MATVLPRLGEVGGALGGIRTHGLSLRRAALYPSELQAHETDPDPGDLCDYDTREGGAEGAVLRFPSSPDYAGDSHCQGMDPVSTRLIASSGTISFSITRIIPGR